MSILNLIIAVVALVIAVMAYQKAGGGDDVRGKTLEVISKLEKALRKEEDGAGETKKKKGSQGESE